MIKSKILNKIKNQIPYSLLLTPYSLLHYAAGRGFEPLQTPPKGVVLPLDDPATNV